MISAIEGMDGIGKTQLAVHAGHLALVNYGIELVLFVNLRGFHNPGNHLPTQPPSSTFPRLLNVPGHNIPYDLEHRTALYRQRLNHRRALIVLDNAANTAQVHPYYRTAPPAWS